MCLWTYVSDKLALICWLQFYLHTCKITMASRTRTRSMPYDLNNPANWTAAQLRAELAQKGLNLTGSVPKTVLKQIYEQMINLDKTNSGHHAEPVGHSYRYEDVSSQNVQSSDNSETNSLPVTSDSATGQWNTLTSSLTTGSGASVSSNNDVTQLLVQNTLGMMTWM